MLCSSLGYGGPSLPAVARDCSGFSPRGSGGATFLPHDAILMG